jgi:protein HOOK3
LDERPPIAVSTGDAYINKLQNEKDELQRQIAEIKDSLLESEKSNGELKASLAAIKGSTDGSRGELEKRVLQLQDKLEDRREKDMKAREVHTYYYHIIPHMLHA